MVAVNVISDTPMNQFDLVASPMRTSFVKGDAPEENFKPWTHLPNRVPLDEGVTASSANPAEGSRIKALRAAWLQKKAIAPEDVR
jgi:hypothetical protein